MKRLKPGMGFVDIGANLGVFTLLSAFFQETARPLRTGGLLLISTDYWEEKVDTEGVQPYRTALGDTMNFDRTGIHHMLHLAASHGLRFSDINDFDLSCRDRVVHWRRIGLSYTFILLAFQLKNELQTD